MIQKNHYSHLFFKDYFFQMLAVIAVKMVHSEVAIFDNAFQHLSGI